ncbi:MAG: choline-sulfatase [Pseudomonadota bacterium]
MTASNILLIQTDQLVDRVLPAYGDLVCHAPHINALAERGTVFETAYCNFPLCGPSRFSMATGQYASRVGAWDNGAEWPAEIPTYAHYMRSAGYLTCLAGKMHFVGPDQLHGFEQRLTSDIYPSDFLWSADWAQTDFHGATDERMVTECGPSARTVQIDYDEETTFEAVRWLYDYRQGRDQRPFFLHVSYTHPHDPYLCHERHWALYEDRDIPMPRVFSLPDEAHDPHSLRILKQHGLHGLSVSHDQVRRARRAYYGSVSFIDELVGQLVATLAAADLMRSTVIIFTSDHGEMFGERGLWLKKMFFEPAMRIPMIVVDPSVPNGSRVRTPVSLVDILPTCLTFAGRDLCDDPEAPDVLDGTDMMSLPGGDTERPVYSELLSEGTPAPAFMIRKGPYKYITCELYPDMLFDLSEDPDELCNLAERPEHATRMTEFAAEARARWDTAALSRDIRRSQRRRKLINAALAQGDKTTWDYIPPPRDPWYRGDGDYNSWAFDHLPLRRRK